MCGLMWTKLRQSNRRIAVLVFGVMACLLVLVTVGLCWDAICRWYQFRRLAELIDVSKDNVTIVDEKEFFRRAITFREEDYDFVMKKLTEGGGRERIAAVVVFETLADIWVRKSGVSQAIKRYETELSRVSSTSSGAERRMVESLRRLADQQPRRIRIRQ